MTAFIVENELLNNVEGWFSAPIDKAVTLPQQHGGNWYDAWKPWYLDAYDSLLNHGMDAVISSLREEGYK